VDLLICAMFIVARRVHSSLVTMGAGGSPGGKNGPLADQQAVDPRGAQLGTAGIGPVRLAGLLGEGGMAQVYLGYHDGLGHPVAVKRLRRQLADVEQARARLRAEGEIVRGLRHRHIVNVLDLVTDPAGDSYLVMEHLAGEPLSARLARTGALPLSEALVIGLQISDALEAVHRRGVVHRDVKTENVLVGLDAGGNPIAKLVDFGVAEILGNPTSTRSACSCTRWWPARRRSTARTRPSCFTGW